MVFPENIGPTTTCISPGDEKEEGRDADSVCNFLVEREERVGSMGNLLTAKTELTSE